MDFSWQEEVFKGAIGIVLAWGGIYVGKRIKPLFRYVKNWIRVKRIAEKLETDSSVQQNTLRALLNIDKHPIFITNNEAEVEWVNRAWLEMTGIGTMDDALGFGFLSAIPVEDRDIVLEQGERIKNHPSNFVGEVRFRNVKSGKIINTWCISEVVYDHEDNFVNIIGRLYVVE